MGGDGRSIPCCPQRKSGIRDTNLGSVDLFDLNKAVLEFDDTYAYGYKQRFFGRSCAAARGGRRERTHV
ncbi:unnamed protein product [Prunus armeniaca]|uniref:Uncharacterized protein n=1 Tax=Prunus armeniaca TaxID=36596 RepID=A0A6J5X316_PRUAR|nr:unnamed protein product [Prunus armeniaca]